MTGLDPAPTSIGIARAHAVATGAELEYRVGAVEDLAKEGAKFDVVLAMEVVEHVHDIAGFVAQAASLLKPNGLFALSTLNRTLKSFGWRSSEPNMFCVGCPKARIDGSNS